MGITFLLASFYMWKMKIPGFPFGSKEVRWLLILRGFGGFFGVSAMYYSLIYLPLADATVLTFLSPVIACVVCAYLLKEKFTRLEQIATVVSLSGVILIGRPSAIFQFFNGAPDEQVSGMSPALNSTVSEQTTVANHMVTSHEKVIAVGVAMVGVIGGAIVITTLRSIGSRAHPLITVNYFASMVTVVSAFICAVVPSIGFAAPKTPREWGFLFFLGICGFTAVSIPLNSEYLLT
jgi:drug/metabolite transporter (DMT)-like permease